VSGFTDPLVDCKQCKNRLPCRRSQDQGHTPASPTPSAPYAALRARSHCAPPVHLMFKTFMGPVEDEAAVTYPAARDGAGDLRQLSECPAVFPAEDSLRDRAGREGVRNEITPGNFISARANSSRWEMQFLVKPGSETEWFEFWRTERMNWVKGLGIRDEKLRWHQHGKDELRALCQRRIRLQYEFPFGWQEFEGIHNRTDFDLSNHQKHRGEEARLPRSEDQRAVSCRT